jgi:hypothetical protein
VIVGLAIFVVAAVLLVSMGGAIVAAPLTLPALALAVRRRPTRGFRIAGAIIGGITAAEVAWAAFYLIVGEAPNRRHRGQTSSLSQNSNTDQQMAFRSR